MDIVKATRSYEAWAAQQLARRGLAPIGPDLARKHSRMAKNGPFAFLRATYYRWAQLWPERCAGLARGPRVLAVGDLHVENFGTWRDAEGRLCWGVNDFDEAYTLPYTNDLVRLAASATLAAAEGALKAKPRDIADAILDGYGAALARGGAPLVLEEHNTALRAMAYRAEAEPEAWWQALENELFAVRPPAEARALLTADWPNAGIANARFCYRSAGSGSLGRPRYVALAQWHGSFIAREAKALVPSAAAWAAGARDAPSVSAAALAQSVRCPDPFLRIEAQWVLRRLAPRASKIELGRVGKKGAALRLLAAMGAAAANVHAGAQRALAPVRRDLDRRRNGWLADAAETMADAVRGEWKVWKKAMAE